MPTPATSRRALLPASSPCNAFPPYLRNTNVMSGHSFAGRFVACCLELLPGGAPPPHHHQPIFAVLVGCRLRSAAPLVLPAAATRARLQHHRLPLSPSFLPCRQSLSESITIISGFFAGGSEEGSFDGSFLGRFLGESFERPPPPLPAPGLASPSRPRACVCPSEGQDGGTAPLPLPAPPPSAPRVLTNGAFGLSATGDFLSPQRRGLTGAGDVGAAAPVPLGSLRAASPAASGLGADVCCGGGGGCCCCFEAAAGPARCRQSGGRGSLPGGGGRIAAGAFLAGWVDRRLAANPPIAALAFPMKDCCGCGPGSTSSAAAPEPLAPRPRFAGDGPAACDPGSCEPASAASASFRLRFRCAEPGEPAACSCDPDGGCCCGGGGGGGGARGRPALPAAPAPLARRSSCALSRSAACSCRTTARVRTRSRLNERL